MMINLSKQITNAEVETAAAYFSALQPRRRIKVVESDTVPKSYIACLERAAKERDEREPLGNRILEIPDNLIRYESHDPRSTFTACVPIGSLAKGEALVTRGGPGKTFQCATCQRGPERAWTFAEHRRPIAELANSTTSGMARGPASGAR